MTPEPDNQTTEERYYRDSDMQQAYQEGIEHEKIMTTEERLIEARVRMTFYKPFRTAVRNERENKGYIKGWYYTEPVYPLSIGV